MVHGVKKMSSDTERESAISTQYVRKTGNKKSEEITNLGLT